MSAEEVSPKLKEIGVGQQWYCIKTGSRGRKQRILRLAEDGIISIRPKSAHHPAKECSFHRWKKLKFAKTVSPDAFIIVYTQDDEQRNFESKDYIEIVDKINQCISYFTGRQIIVNDFFKEIKNNNKENNDTPGNDNNSSNNNNSNNNNSNNNSTDTINVPNESQQTVCVIILIYYVMFCFVLFCFVFCLVFLFFIVYV